MIANQSKEIRELVYPSKVDELCFLADKCVLYTWPIYVVQASSHLAYLCRASIALCNRHYNLPSWQCLFVSLADKYCTYHILSFTNTDTTCLYIKITKRVPEKIAHCYVMNSNVKKICDNWHKCMKSYINTLWGFHFVIHVQL